MAEQLSLMAADKLFPIKSKWTPPDSFPDLSSAKTLAIDLETCDPGLKEFGPGTRRGSFIAGVAIGTDDGWRGYYPITHETGGNFSKKSVLSWLKEELSRPHQTKIGANIMYDLEFLACAGVTVQGKIYDVQYAEPLLDENKQSYSLDSIATTHLGEHKVSDEMYKWIKMAYGGPDSELGSNIWRTPVSLVGPYAEGDVDLPLRIFEKQRQQLEAEGLFNLFELECSLIPMLLAMRLQGVRVDVAKAQRIGESLGKKMAELQRTLDSLAGFKINVHSADEIAKLFDKNGIWYPRTPKTGKPSFVKGWLEAQVSSHPIIDLILQIRKFSTILNTFIKGYILEKNINGRLYCMFHPLRSDDGGTVSGRFCVAEDTVLYLNTGPVRIGEYNPTGNEYILTHKNRWRRILRRIYKGKEFLTLLKLSDGSIIKATKNHRVLTQKDGWKSIKDLHIGEEIITYGREQSICREPRKCGQSSGTISWEGQTNKIRSGLSIKHHDAQCKLDTQEQIVSPAVQVRKEVAIFSFKNWGKQSHDREVWRRTSQLQGRIGLRLSTNTKTRLVHRKIGIKPCVCSSCGDLRTSWYNRNTNRICCASYRQESKEQQYSQSCSYNSQGSYTFTSARVTSIDPLDEASEQDVWDIEVEEDHSYLAHGMFHHNSSSLPNLQNIPGERDRTTIVVDGIEMLLGKAIRSLFIPEEDCLWTKDDYSQVEFRLITHYGEGEAAEVARQQYNDDPTTDFHTMVSKMCGIPRGPAKGINFGLAYNMGEEKLSASLNIPVEEARELFAQYHERLPFVKGLQEATSNTASNRGYIKTFLGRRARFPLWESCDWETSKRETPTTEEKARKKWGRRIRRAFTYKAMNRLIQGSAADVMKKAMSEIWKSGVCDVLGAPHITVHDELDWSVTKTKEAKEAHDEVLNIMQTSLKFKIPLICDSESGPSWGEVK